MKSSALSALLVATLCTATPGLAAGPSTSNEGEVALAWRTLRTFDIHLPAETFVPIGAGVAFAGAPDGRFAAAVTDAGLGFDRDGDGAVDGTVGATDADHPTRLLTFRTADGAEFAVRAKLDGRWLAAPGGAMMGALGKTPVMFIDQNGNGRFDDIGADAIVVGRSKVASYLSEVVSIDGKLMNLAVAADGSAATFTPYTGAVGKLDLGSAFDSKAKLRALVLNSTDGRYSFELSAAVGAKGALDVPTGSYRIHSGQLVLGKSTATIGAGRAADLEVQAGTTASLAWGGPIQAEIDYAYNGSELVIAPEDITYFGRAGEAYTGFMPLGSSPAFQVKDRTTGDVLVDMVFPGNC